MSNDIITGPQGPVGYSHFGSWCQCGYLYDGKNDTIENHYRNLIIQIENRVSNKFNICIHNGYTEFLHRIFNNLKRFSKGIRLTIHSCYTNDITVTWQNILYDFLSTTNNVIEFNSYGGAVCCGISGHLDPNMLISSLAKHERLERLSILSPYHVYVNKKALQKFMRAKKCLFDLRLHRVECDLDSYILRRYYGQLKICYIG